MYNFRLSKLRINGCSMLKWPKSIKISNYSCYLLLPRISFVATNTVDESLEYANGIFNFVLLYFIWNENNRRTIFIGSTWDFNRFFTSDSRYPTKKIRFSCMYPNNYMFPKDNFFPVYQKRTTNRLYFVSPWLRRLAATELINNLGKIT